MTGKEWNEYYRIKNDDSPSCPECKEQLFSHAGRGHKYFHEWAFGLYDGSSSGKCSLDGLAFERDGTPIRGSDNARKEWVEELHGHKK